MSAPKCRCGAQLQESDKLGAASFVCPKCGKVIRPSRADSAGHPPPMLKPEASGERERSVDVALIAAVVLTIVVVGVVAWVLIGRGAKKGEDAGWAPAAPRSAPVGVAADEAAELDADLVGRAARLARG